MRHERAIRCLMACAAERRLERAKALARYDVMRRHWPKTMRRISRECCAMLLREAQMCEAKAYSLLAGEGVRLTQRRLDEMAS